MGEGEGGLFMSEGEGRTVERGMLNGISRTIHMYNRKRHRKSRQIFV